MKKILFVFSFLLSCLAVFSQSKGALQPMIDQLGLYYSANPNEKIIIQTDKDFYQPGENIWFSCWYWNENKSQSSPGQSEMEVRLLGPNGETVLSDRYRVRENLGSGDFVLPDDLEAGNYFLAALFPGQENAENIYFRKISIRPFYQNSLLISVAQKNEFLQKGINNEINVQVKSLPKGSGKNQKLEYTISAGGQTINEGKLKTDDDGKAVIQFRLPETDNGTPFILSVFDSKKESVETVQLVSETDQLNITFYPEGSTLIPDASVKIGFHVTDKSGNLVNIEGEIRDSENQVVGPVRTLCEGFGFFPLKAAGNMRYSLLITKGLAKGRQFQLPPVNARGSSLALIRTDANFLWMNLAFADKLSHKISVMASQGAKVYWAADLQINGAGLLKIPVADLPQGVVLLSSFSGEGALLNQRLVNVSRSADLKIDILPASESVVKKDEIDLQLRFTDEKGRSLPGVAQLSVGDRVCTSKQSPVLPIEITYNTILKNKIFLDSDGTEMQKTIDCLLIANELSNHDWSRISGFKAGNTTGMKLPFSEKFEASLKEKVKSFNQVKLVSAASVIPEKYFDENSGLILKKVRKTASDVAKNDSYKRYLSTGTSLLEVIKVIKPFQLRGNKIVFLGGNNSLIAQGGALIVIDGQILGEDATVLNNVSPQDVDKINVSTNPMDIQKYTGLNSVGVIEITTKRGTTETPSSGEKTEAVLYDGDYRVPREFSIAEKTGLRTTACWNGRLFVDETGKASLKIPNPNVISEFVITVEGLGGNGQFGHASKVIKVME